MLELKLKSIEMYFNIECFNVNLNKSIEQG